MLLRKNLKPNNLTSILTPKALITSKNTIVSTSKTLKKYITSRLVKLSKPFLKLNTLPNKTDFKVKGTSFSTRPIYLDAQSTTPVDPRVLDSMLPFLSGIFGNSGSRTHVYGWESEEAVEKAREQVAKVINCRPKDIIFTSGATESNSLAIRGYLDFLEQSGTPPDQSELITVKTEHKAVLEVFRDMEQRGYKVTYLTPEKDGRIALPSLKAALSNKTKLVSIMHVNNEIGVVQDIESIAKEIEAFNKLNSPKHRILFHSDIAQSYGKLPLDVKKIPVDFLSISGHKIYGPKGVGALFINSQPSVGRRPRLKPLLIGGGQERGVRAGTIASPLVVGLGKAAELARENKDRDYKRIKYLSDKLRAKMLAEEGVYLNGSSVDYWPGCNNFSFDYVEGESLLIGLKGLALSSGSACTSTSLEPSYVLKSLGIGDELAHTSIRFGIGRFTTEKDIDKAVEETKNWVKTLRDVSPLYEMAKEGIDISKIEWAH